MKKSLFLSCIFSITSIALFAQKQDTIPFKHAQKLILKNKLSASDNFLMAGKMLLDKNYMIGTKDEQFNQITSAPIKVPFGSQVIYIVAKDNEIDITGKFSNKNALQMVSFVTHENSAKPVEYNKNYEFDVARFNYLVNFAKSLKFDSITYSE